MDSIQAISIHTGSVFIVELPVVASDSLGFKLSIVDQLAKFHARQESQSFLFVFTPVTDDFKYALGNRISTVFAVRSSDTKPPSDIANLIVQSLESIIAQPEVTLYQTITTGSEQHTSKYVV